MRKKLRTILLALLLSLTAKQGQAGYLCQFVFFGVDETQGGKPLDIKLSRATFKTANLLETEVPVHVEIGGWSSDKGLRVLIEDFDYVKQEWGDEDIKRFFYSEKVLPFDEISEKLQTLWLTIEGEEVPFSWEYDLEYPLRCINPSGYQFQWRGGGEEPKYRKTEKTRTRPRPIDTQPTAGTFLIWKK